MAQPLSLHGGSRVGAALAGTSCALHTLNRLGSPLSFGAGAPVEDCNPFPAWRRPSTAPMKRGCRAGGFGPQERMTAAQAVDCHTAGSAKAARAA